MIKSALNDNLCVCPVCHKTNALAVNKIICSRCKHKFYARTPNSIQFTLAWTVAAIIMLFPANMFPIMIFITLGIDSETTVLSGVQTLIQLGMYPVALVVFVASFIVPIGKILGLLILSYHVTHKRQTNLKTKARMYHIIEFLGPWSMLDVFVVTLMAAVVSLGFLTKVSAGAGLTYFALMVVFTMFAAQSFDPRLIWDNKNTDG